MKYLRKNSLSAYIKCNKGGEEWMCNGGGLVHRDINTKGVLSKAFKAHNFFNWIILVRGFHRLVQMAKFHLNKFDHSEIFVNTTITLNICALLRYWYKYASVRGSYNVYAYKKYQLVNVHFIPILYWHEKQFGCNDLFVVIIPGCFFRTILIKNWQITRFHWMWKKKPSMTLNLHVLFWSFFF